MLGKAFNKSYKIYISCFLLFLFCFSGCSVVLISKYDEQIDKNASALQQEMDSFLTRLEIGPQPTYSESKSFYLDYTVKLRSILIRVRSHPKNELTAKQLELMINSVEEFRKLHEQTSNEQKLISSDAISKNKDLFNIAWQAVITLELAKKRGEK